MGRREDADRVDWSPSTLLGWWNLGELAAYALPRLGIVVLGDVVSRARECSPPWYSVARGVIVLAYGLAATAAVLHVGTDLWRSGAIDAGVPAAHGFVADCAARVHHPIAAELGTPRLARLFAVSATHLGSFHTAAIPLRHPLPELPLRAWRFLFLKQALTPARHRRADAGWRPRRWRCCGTRRRAGCCWDCG